MVRLYHGTVQPHAGRIVDAGVDLSRVQAGTDFGPGFYTTTVERQAKHWAYRLATQQAATSAAVVRLDMDRDELARLDTLAFARGDFEAEDFWSFVVHCRKGAPDHARGGHGFYDVVIGPVASFWQQRALIYGADQISFHTAAAERVLNSSPRMVTWTWNR